MKLKNSDIFKHIFNAGYCNFCRLRTEDRTFLCGPETENVLTAINQDSYTKFSQDFDQTMLQANP